MIVAILGLNIYSKDIERYLDFKVNIHVHEICLPKIIF